MSTIAASAPFMASDLEILQTAAKDGSLDSSEWPALLEQILPRLDHIVHHEFPIPTVPSPRNAPALANDPANGDLSAVPNNIGPSSQPSSFETAATGPPQGSSPPPAPSQLPPTSTPEATSQHVTIPDSQNLAQQPHSSVPLSQLPSSGTLPAQLRAFYDGITTALRRHFSRAPPYTVQRLAELLLHPRAHYRTLPSYLRALDRVVSVSSAADEFPLPSAATGADAASAAGANYLASSATHPGVPGNDDFNGAALTRIPWVRDVSMAGTGPMTAPGADLRTESTAVIDGPHGAGSMETVTVAVNGLSSGQARAAALAREQQQQAQQQHQAQQKTAQTAASTTSGPSDSPITTAMRSEMRTDLPMSVDAAESTPSTAVATPATGDTGPDEELLDAAAAPEEEEGPPHARGPEEIGVADMGPQVPGETGAAHVFDVDAAMGRPGEGELVRLPESGNAEGEKSSAGGNGDGEAPDGDHGPASTGTQSKEEM